MKQLILWSLLIILSACGATPEVVELPQEIATPEVEESPSVRLRGRAVVSVGLEGVQSLMDELIGRQGYSLWGSYNEANMSELQEIIVLYNDTLLSRVPLSTFGVSSLDPGEMIVQTQPSGQRIILIRSISDVMIGELMFELTLDDFTIEGRRQLNFYSHQWDDQGDIDQYGRIGILTNLLPPPINNNIFFPLRAEVFNDPQKFYTEDFDTRVILYNSFLVDDWNPIRYGEPLYPGTARGFFDEAGTKYLLVYVRSGLAVENINARLLDLQGRLAGQALMEELSTFDVSSSALLASLSNQAPLEVCRIPNLADRSNFRTAQGGIGFPFPDYFMPTSGVARIGILYVDFADYRWTSSNSIESMSRFVQSPVEDYYQQMSGGRVQFDWVVSEQVMSLGLSASSYDIYGFRAGKRDIYMDIEPQLANYFSPRSIDGLLVMINPNVPLHLRDTVWASILSFGNQPLFTMIIGMNATRDGLGNIISHDIGHFFGLPDLYSNICFGNSDCENGTIDWRLQFQYAGAWSLMSNGNHQNNELLAWERWLLSWIDDQAVHCINEPEEHIIQIVPSLSQHQGNKMIVVNLDTHFNLVLEMKQRGPYCQSCDTGLLVYTVDSTKSGFADFIRVIRPAHSTDILFEDALLLPREGFRQLRYNEWLIEIVETNQSGFIVRIKPER